MTTLGALHREARARLAEAGVENAALDARLLVEHFTGTSRMDAIADPAREIDGTAAAAVKAALGRRIAHEPMHRILGRREFWSLDLRLSPATLEPRPDTETLVDLCLPFLKERAAAGRDCRILDLGTGTGAIALALLDAVPAAIATGVDISEEALAKAAGNARDLGLGGRFKALHSNWFEKVSGSYHVIASNPPYIPSQEIGNLQDEVRDFDPHRALDGGADGLDPYRVIAAEAAGFLETQGRVAVEIGHTQKNEVSGIFAAAGYVLTGTHRDLGGNDRVLVFERRKP